MIRRLGALAATVILLAVSPTAAGTLPDEVAAHLDEFVLGRMAAWDTPGLSLVVVRDGEVALRRGYGFADREAGRPMTDETLLVLGSTTKAMTALAVMQLVEAGEIELDAPVTRYLPWFTTPGGRQDDITVRHLLSHSSGYPWGILFTGRPYPSEREAYVRWLAGVRLEAEPGTRFGYSNDTFVVLGLIIEEVAGVSYETYMRDAVLEPLGMTRTTFDVEVAAQRGLARGYRHVSGRSQPLDVDFFPSERSAGKLMTSAAELANYFIMLQGGGRFDDRTLISEASLDHMWTPVVPVDLEGVSYGLAWYLEDVGGLRLVSHPGSVRNSGSRFVLVPEASLAVGLLSNVSRPLDPRDEIVESITVSTLVFGDAPLEAAEVLLLGTQERDAALWRAVVGVYDSAAGPVAIVDGGDALVGTVAGHPFELQAIGGTTFLVRSDFAALDGLELEFRGGRRSPGPDDHLALMGQLFAFRSG